MYAPPSKPPLSQTQAATILQRAYKNGFFNRGYKYFRHQQYAGINIPKQSKKNQEALQRRLGPLNPSEEQFYQFFTREITHQFTAKHGMDDVTAIQRSGALISVADRSRKKDSRLTARTGGVSRQEFLYFVLGIGDGHPLPLFVGDNASVIKLSFAKLTQADKQIFQGAFISNHDADYERSSYYGPVYFGETAVTVKFDSKSQTKTTRFFTPGRETIEEIVGPQDEIIAIAKNVDALFDYLALKFIEYLRYLDPAFQKTILESRDINIIKTVFHALFPSHRFPELKLVCKQLPLNTPCLSVVPADPHFYRKVFELHRTVLDLDVAAAEKLITPLNVNYRNHDDDTLLSALLQHISRASDEIKLIHMIKLLLNNGANVNSRHLSFVSALAAAIKTRIPEAVDLLLQGSRVKTFPLIRSCPTIDAEALREAVSVRDYDLFIRLFSSRPIIRNPNSFLISVCESFSSDMANQQKYAEPILPLIDVNTFVGSKTLLMIAAEKGWRWLVITLLKMPSILIDHQILTANGSIAEFEGWTALHFAAWKGHSEIVDALLAANTNATIQDYYGHTAADIAKQVLEGQRKTSDQSSQIHQQMIDALWRQMYEEPLFVNTDSKNIDPKVQEKYQKVLNLLPKPLDKKTNDSSQQLKLHKRTLAGIAIISATVKDKRYLLLVRKGDSNREARGYYQFPGGLAEMGEDLLSTALREAQEETGVSCKPQATECVYTFEKEIRKGELTRIQFFHIALGQLETLPKLCAKSDIAVAHWVNIDESITSNVIHNETHHTNYIVYHYRNVPIRQDNSLLLSELFFQKKFDLKTIEFCTMMTIVQGGLLYELVRTISSPDFETTKKELLKDEIMGLVKSAIVDINSYSPTGVTPVSVACVCNARDNVDFLIALGANINQRINTVAGSYTVLELSISMKYFPLAKYLIETQQTNADAYKDGISALSVACNLPDVDIEFIKYIVSRMRNLDESVIGSALLHVTQHGRIEIANFLLSLRPINLNCPYPSTNGKHYVLLSAVRNINVGLVRLLCENGASGEVMLNTNFDIKGFALANYNSCKRDCDILKMEVGRKRQAAENTQSQTTYKPYFWSQASQEPEKNLLAKEQTLAAYREINQLLGNPLPEEAHRGGINPLFP